MTRLYTPEEAPTWAKFASSFKNDPRCYPVLFVVGEKESKVWSDSMHHFDPTIDIDYDVGYSSEVELYVGVIVRDHAG